MTNEVVTNKTFEEKMRDRIRDNIGDLIDDEKLSQLIERGMEDAFFKNRHVTQGTGYSQKVITKPPLIQEVLHDLMEEKMKEGVRLWCSDHSEELMQHLKQTLEKAPTDLFLKSLVSIFEKRIIDMQYGMRTDIVDMLNRAGMNVY